MIRHQCDQVWVGDITYVRLKGHFVYVAVLMDVFTRMIRGWHQSAPEPTPDTFRTGTLFGDPSF